MRPLFCAFMVSIRKIRSLFGFKWVCKIKMKSLYEFNGIVIKVKRDLKKIP